MDKLVHIFRAGEHTPLHGRLLTFTKADIREMAASYDPEIAPAPIVLGHPKTDAPAYGWVKRLEAQGPELYAEFMELDPGFIEMVREGRYKRISACFYGRESTQSPVAGKWYLRHVGFLGAAAPAVKGLKQVSFADNEEGVFSFQASEAELIRQKVHDLERQLAKRDTEQFINNAMESGHVLPRERAFVSSFMETLVETTYSFADGAGNLEKQSQIAAFKDFVTNRPPLVNFAEVTGGASDEPEHQSLNMPKGYTVREERQQLHYQALAIQKTENISYEQALKKAAG